MATKIEWNRVAEKDQHVGVLSPDAILFVSGIAPENEPEFWLLHMVVAADAAPATIEFARPQRQHCSLGEAKEQCELEALHWLRKAFGPLLAAESTVQP